MPHKIDTDELTRNAFILRHLAVGNQGVFLDLQFTRDSDRERSCGWGDLGLRLEELVSSLLIESAVKFRIILDFIRKLYAEPPGGPPFEDVFRDKDSVGHFIPSMHDLRIREACNKIIHADRVDLEWQGIQRTEYECWTGTVLLSGRKGAKDWQCRIVATEFSNVLEKYVEEIGQRGDYHGAWSG